MPRPRKDGKPSQGPVRIGKARFTKDGKEWRVRGYGPTSGATRGRVVWRRPDAVFANPAIPTTLIAHTLSRLPDTDYHSSTLLTRTDHTDASIATHLTIPAYHCRDLAPLLGRWCISTDHVDVALALARTRGWRLAELLRTAHAIAEPSRG